MEWMHTYPSNDLIEHDTTKSGTDDFICQCNPKVDPEHQLIVHSAMDRRECFEED